MREALGQLVAEYPALETRVLEGEGVPSFLNVFVDGDDVSGTTGAATSLRGARTIDILHSIAGG